MNTSWLALNKTTLRMYAVVGIISYALALVQFASPIAHEGSFIFLIGPFVAFVWWLAFLVLLHFFRHNRKIFYVFIVLLFVYVWACWGIANVTSCAHGSCKNKPESEITGRVFANFLSSVPAIFPLLLLIPGGLLVQPKVMR